ncbi:MAG: carbohydrate ABC transporter permease [Sphaerochaetaceae bacterium]|nr:carbohydrate ABC transporter permease [Sphaerochaetaceae bacterium]MDD4763494.1 carbohydrate ABC transporter permease [Sphaerochaetaceae bacterium]
MSSMAIEKPVKNFHISWGRIISLLLLVIAAVVVLVPIVWLILTSFKYYRDIIRPTFVFEWNIDNFKSLIVEDKDFIRMFFNSIIISVVTMVLCTLFSSAAAYSLLRLSWNKNARTFIRIILLSLEIIPSITIIIPLYTIGIRTNLIDTRIFLIMIYTLFNAPFVFFLMGSNLSQIPVELEESGLIDGASRFTIFWKLVLPVTVPILMTGALFSFIFAWKEFLIGLSLTSTPLSMTLNVKIAGFIQSYSVKYGEMAASASLGAIPGILLCIFTQKYIVSGITQGAIKG